MTEMRLFDLRVTVERIEGRSVCGLEVGDYFEVTESNRIRIPEGKHFCMYALQSSAAPPAGEAAAASVRTGSSRTPSSAAPTPMSGS